MKLKVNRALKVNTACLGIVFGLSGCTSAFPPRDSSTLDSINAQMKQAAVKDKPAAVPEAVSTSLLPPLKGELPRASKKQLEQRFDLVVTDAPITQVLMGLVHSTKYSIMVKPKAAIARAPGETATSAETAERITVTLKNVTIFEALDSIREVYGYDYSVDGNRIYVSQPELQTRLYQVNYIIGQRRGVNDLQVIGGATIGKQSSSSSNTSSSTASTATPGVSNYSSIQATGLSAMSKSDLWGEVEDVVRTTLGCQIPETAPMAVATGTQATAAQNQASRADVAFRGEVQKDKQQRGVDGCTDGRAMSISQMAGTVLVRGMPNEHRTIEKILKTLQINIERQVIIEAKIIDVTLNAGSQQGINWADFNHGLHRASAGYDPTQVYLNQPAYNVTTYSNANGTETMTLTPSSDYGGTTNFLQTLGGTLGTAMLAPGSAVAGGLGLAFQFRNFAALINFLQTKGEVQVLSSPRIATLNNQKAVLKVGTEEPYVSSINSGSSNQNLNTTVTVAPSLNYQPFFSGIALDVTPKVDDKGDITLHVHALVNSISEKDKVSSPAANAVRVPFAVNTINETDSVVKAKDGQVVVIGGLMTESMSDNRGKTPGVGDVPGIGALFSKGGQQKQKRELVILLKSTVVADDNVWSSDIMSSQQRIEAMGAAAATPSEATGESAK